MSAAKSDRPDLQTAKRVISGGRALGSAENFGRRHKEADKLGAAVGASRAAAGAGYAPGNLQVGQTGEIIAPGDISLSGFQERFSIGRACKDARTVVAINKDAGAPIFEVAGYGLVGDLFTIIPELGKLI